MRNRFVAVVLGLGVLGAAGVAHVWYITRGVHFKGERVDFGAPPARLTMTSSETLFANDTRPGTVRLEDDYYKHYRQEDQQIRNKDIAARLRRSSSERESNGLYRDALNQYRRLIQVSPSEDFAKVRTELLPIAIRNPRLPGIKEVLASTRPGAKPLSAERIARLPKEIAPYALYDEAMKTPGDPRLFERLAREYPNSPRTEAALIMIPRRLLSEPVNEKTPDLKSRAGRSYTALQTLSKRFPKSRFRYDAAGWRGRIDLLMGRPNDALRHFDVQDKLAKDLGQRIRVADSRLIVYRALNDRPRYALSLIHRFQTGGIDYRLASRRLFFDEVAGFSSEQSKQFLNLILADSEAFPSYFDLRFDTSELSTSQVAELARVAVKWSNRHPSHPRSSRVLARVAEVHYLQNRPPEARFAAETVLKRKGRSEEGLALAHYILGSIDRRRNRFASAQRHYETIVHRYPKTYLGPGAREALAVVHERRGNVGGALDQYFALGYKYDVAYMLDARMTTRQIADYLAHRPGHHRRELIAYSLGVRYVREGNYPAARSVLGRIPERRRRELAWLTKKPGEYGLFSYENDKSLRDPYRVASELSRLHTNLKRAKSEAAKGDAYLALASYFDKNRNLALYNPSLWDGNRADAIGFSWNPGVNTKSDDEALKKHHYEHECLAQTLRYAKEAVAAAPKAKSTPKAAWLGIVAAMRLAELNIWWRNQAGDGKLHDQGVNLCRAIMKHHPGSPESERAEHKIRDLLARKEDARQRMAEMLRYHNPVGF